MADKTAGPFSPGLNVVFGQNETGKTTIASFIGGVLFGWEESRGVRNTYRFKGGQRRGSLVFANREDGDGANDEENSDVVRLARSRNEDGLQGDDRIVADIDRSTFKTMFSLTSDELRTLRNTSDITARLLTAGSGTGSSPSGAFVEVEQRIAALTSQRVEGDRSVICLERQLEEKRAQIRAETERVSRYWQEGRELKELRESRARATERVEALNREIEDLISWRAELESLDGNESRQREELSALNSEREQLMLDSAGATHFDERVLALDSAGDRALRDKIDEFAEAREKIERIVDTAKENSATSAAAYEALMELDEKEAHDRFGRSRSMKDRSSQAVVSIVPTLVFILAGIFLFVHGRQIASLSFTVLGLGLIVFAFFLAAAAIVVLFRPNKDAGVIGDRQKDAQWVMLQDKKKLDSSRAESARLDDEIEAFLQASGLSAAHGSLRQARLVLDDAREERARIATASQRMTAIDLRIRAISEELSSLEADRHDIKVNAGLLEGASSRAVEDIMRAKIAQRDALLEVSDGMSQRYGELVRELERAKNDHDLDAVKLEYHQIRTRLLESKHELMVLLLAKRILERSIASWESDNQPEVYAEASRLLSLITDGAWVQVSMSSSGSVVARSCDGTLRESRHLSLGTCQQLYLSLRIAMLLLTDNVGSSIPVLADDILVNFDANRRKGAACALAELASKRQVIMFTCHEETVAALREADPDLRYLSL